MYFAEHCGFSPAWSSPVYTAFSLAAALDGDIPAKMFDESKEHSSKQAMKRYSHLTEWPRLLAKKFQHRLKDMHSENIRGLLVDVLRSEPAIVGLQLGFEPYILERYSHLVSEHETSLLFGCSRDTSVVGEEQKKIGNGEQLDNSLYFFRNVDSNDYRFSQWYKNAKAMDSGIWSEYVSDSSADALAMCYSVPIRANGLFVGVLSMLVPADGTGTAGLDGTNDNSHKSLSKTVESQSDEERSQKEFDTFASGPRRLAERMFRNEVYDSTEEADLQATKISMALHELIQSHNRIFGACIAFCSNVFNHEDKQSFYICKNASDQTEKEYSDDTAVNEFVTDDDNSIISPILVHAHSGGEIAERISENSADVDLHVVSGGRRFSHIADPEDVNRYRVTPLDYDYREHEWFEFTVRECKDHWSKPYFDEGGAGKWIVTYSVPFFTQKSERTSDFDIGGVITIDILYDDSVKHLFTKLRATDVNRITCFSCGHSCSRAYWTPKSRLIQSCICQRCVRSGLLPRNTRFKDLQFVADRSWYEWWNQVRTPGREVYFGQKVQLRHKFSGEILCLKLHDSNFHSGSQCVINEADGKLLKTKPFQLYKVSTDCEKDPYGEGSLDSWFTIQSPDHQSGEPVKWGSQIEFVSVRWNCPLSVCLDSASLRMISTGAVMNAGEEDVIAGRWRLIPFSREVSSKSDVVQSLSQHQHRYSTEQAVISADVKRKLVNIHMGIGGASGFGIPLELTNSSTMNLLKPNSEDDSREISEISLFRPTRILELGAYGSGSKEGESDSEQDHHEKRLQSDNLPSLLGSSEKIYLHGGCIIRLSVSIDVGSSDEFSKQQDQWLSADYPSKVGKYTVGQKRVFVNDDIPSAQSSLTASQVLDVADSGEGSGMERSIAKRTNYLAELLDSRTLFGSLWLLQLTSGGGGSIRPGDGFYLYHLASRRYLAVHWEKDGTPGGSNCAQLAKDSRNVDFHYAAQVADIETGIPLESKNAAPLSLVESVADATIFCAQRSCYVDPSEARGSGNENVSSDYFCGLKGRKISRKSVYGANELKRQDMSKLQEYDSSEDGQSDHSWIEGEMQFSSDDHSPIEVNERFFLQCFVPATAKHASSSKFWVGALTSNALNAEIRTLDAQARQHDEVNNSQLYSKTADRVKSLIAGASASKRMAIFISGDYAGGFRGEIVGGYAAIDAYRVSSHIRFLLESSNRLHDSLEIVELERDGDETESACGINSLRKETGDCDDSDSSECEPQPLGRQVAANGVNIRSEEVLSVLDNLLHLTRFLQGAWIDHGRIGKILNGAKDGYFMDIESVKQRCGYGGIVKSRLIDIVMDNSAFQEGRSWWNSVVFPGDTVTEEDEDLEGEDDADPEDEATNTVGTGADNQTGSRMDSASGRSSYAEEIGDGSAPKLNACNARRHRQVLVWEARGVEVLMNTLESCMNICKYVKIPEHVSSQREIMDAASTVALLGLARKVAAVCIYTLYLLLLDHRRACITASSYFDKLLQWTCLRKTKGRPNSADIVIPKEIEQHQDQALAYLVSMVVQVILTTYRVSLTDVPIRDVSLLAFVARRSTEPPLPPRLIQLLNKVVCRSVENQSISAEKQQGTREAEVLDDLADYVPIPSNQWAVVIHFLLQDNAAVVRGVLHPKAPVWHQLGISQPKVTGQLHHVRVRDKHTKVYEHAGIESLISVLQLCSRLCVGAVGVIVRRVLEVLGGFTFERLLHIAFDETLTGQLFRIKTQCCHLLRVMYIEPHAVKWRNSPGESGTGVCASGTANLCASVPGVDAGLSANAFPQYGTDIITDASESSLGPAETGFLLKPGIMRTMALWNSDGVEQDDAFVNDPERSCSLRRVSLLDVLIDKCSHELKLEKTSSIVSVLSDCSRGEADHMVLARTKWENNVVIPIDGLGDCGVPILEKEHVATLVKHIGSYLARCASLSSKNELSLGILALVTALTRRGALTTRQIAYLLPMIISIIAVEQERDAFSSDWQWRSDKKLLLRMKLRSCMLCHLICDYATAHKVRSSIEYFCAHYKDLIENKNANEFLAAVQALYDDSEHDVMSRFVDPSWFSRAIRVSSGNDTLLEAVHRSSWAPLLRLTVSLFYRLKSRADEVFKAFRDTTVLFDDNETRFAKLVGSITWRLKGITLVERTSAEPGEVHVSRAEEVTTVAAMLVQQLHSLFRNHGKHNVSSKRAVDIFLATDCVDVVIGLAKVPFGVVVRSHGGLTVKPELSKVQSQHPLMKVLRQAYAFLFTLASSRDSTILTILRPHLNCFLKYQGCSLGTIDLITELVKGCSRACSLVDPVHIDKTLKRLAFPSTSVSQKVLLVKFLRALMVDLGEHDDDYVCGDIISFRNRQLVVNGLCSGNTDGSITRKDEVTDALGEPHSVKASPTLHTLGYLSTKMGLLYFLGEIDSLCRPSMVLGSVHSWYRRDFDASALRSKVAKAVRRLREYVRLGRASEIKESMPRQTESSAMDSLEIGIDSRLSEPYQIDLYKRLLQALSDSQRSTMKGAISANTDETTFIIRTALSWQGIFSTLLSVTSFALKSRLLHLLWSVWGNDLSTANVEGLKASVLLVGDNRPVYSFLEREGYMKERSNDAEDLKAVLGVSTVRDCTAVGLLFLEVANAGLLWLHMLSDPLLEQELRVDLLQPVTQNVEIALPREDTVSSRGKSSSADLERMSYETDFVDFTTPAEATLFLRGSLTSIMYCYKNGVSQGDFYRRTLLTSTSGRLLRNYHEHTVLFKALNEFLFDMALPFLVELIGGSEEDLIRQTEPTQNISALLFGVLYCIADHILSENQPRNESQHLQQEHSNAGRRCIEEVSVARLRTLSSAIAYLFDPKGSSRNSGVTMEAITSEAETSGLLSLHVTCNIPKRSTDVDRLLNRLCEGTVDCTPSNQMVNSDKGLDKWIPGVSVRSLPQRYISIALAFLSQSRHISDAIKNSPSRLACSLTDFCFNEEATVDHMASDEVLRTIIILLIDDAFKAEESIRSRGIMKSKEIYPSSNASSCWLLDAPYVVSSFLHAFLEIGKREDGQERLTNLGIPQLVVVLLNYLGTFYTLKEETMRVKTRYSTPVQPSASVSGSDVIDVCLELGGVVLDGGYSPAQVRLLETYKATRSSAFLAAIERMLLGFKDLLAIPRRSTIQGSVSEALMRQLSSFRKGVDISEDLYGKVEQNTIDDCSSSISVYANEMALWKQLESLLYFVQQMCEGHMDRWQDELREQTEFVVQHNVVKQMSDFMYTLVADRGPLWQVIVYWDAKYDPMVICQTMKSFLQMLATITEVTQGPCVGNQDLLSNSRLFETIGWVWDAILVAYQQPENTSMYGTWSPLDRSTQEETSLMNGILDSILTEINDAIKDITGVEEEAPENEIMSMARGSLLMYLQDQIIECLSSTLEGGAMPFAVRMVKTLELGCIPKLLGVLLPLAEEEDECTPFGTELSISNERQRISEGVWNGRFAELDLCCKYLVCIKRLSIRLGIGADLSISEILSQVDSNAARDTDATSENRWIAMLARVENQFDYGTKSILRLLADPQILRLRKLCDRHVTQVEVQTKGGVLVPFVFRIPPVVLRHREDADFREARDNVIFSVSRDSPFSRMEDFISECPKLVFELCTYPRLRMFSLVRHITFLMNFTFALAIVINIFLLGTHSHLHDWIGDEIVYIMEASMLPLGLIHAMGALLRFASVLIRKAPGWLNSDNDGEEDDIRVPIKDVRDESPDAELSSKEENSRLFSATKILMRSSVSDPMVMFTCVYALSSVLAVAFGKPALYSVHLFDLITRSALLRETISALKAYSYSLVATGTLWLLLM